MTKLDLSMFDRLWNNTIVIDGCWVWQGSYHHQGYGLLSIGGKTSKVHRVGWSMIYGDIPEGLHVCHSCDNPPCWKPCHLFLGTVSDNMRDSVQKGRHWERSKTHCPQGHPYDVANTYEYKGKRSCKACVKARGLARYHKNKGKE